MVFRSQWLASISTVQTMLRDSAVNNQTVEYGSEMTNSEPSHEFVITLTLSSLVQMLITWISWIQLELVKHN